jgi:hypothetical protein
MSRFDRDLSPLRELRELRERKQSAGLTEADLPTQLEKHAFRFWNSLQTRREMDGFGNGERPLRWDSFEDLMRYVIAQHSDPSLRAETRASFPSAPSDFELRMHEDRTGERLTVYEYCLMKELEKQPQYNAELAELELHGRRY